MVTTTDHNFFGDMYILQKKFDERKKGLCKKVESIYHI